MFSIVIPTFKRNELLRKCLNSLSMQSYKDFEVVIVNDDPFEILSIDESDYSFKVIVVNNEINKGPSASRNIGVKNSNGSWIVFLDDDDEFTHDKLQIISEIVQDEVDVIYHRAKINLVNENKSYITSNNFHNLTFNDSLYHELLTKNVVGGAPLCTVKKSVFTEVGGFDINLHAMEDYEFAIRLAKNKYNFRFIEDVLITCNYISSKSSVSKHIDNNLTALKSIESKYINDYNLLSKKKLLEHKAWCCSSIGYKQALMLNRVSSLSYIKAFIYSRSVKFLIASAIVLISPKLLLKIR